MAGNESASIEAGTEGVTLVNVYEVEETRQAELAQLLSEVTERVIRAQPGFVSVSIHLSLDGARVVNYAQWATKAHFDAFVQNPAMQAELKRFAAVAKSIAPGLYKVDTVHAAGPA